MKSATLKQTMRDKMNNTAQAISEMVDDIDFDSDVNSEDNSEAPEDIEPNNELENEQIQELLEAPQFFEKNHKEIFNKLQGIEGGRDYAQAWYDQYNSNQKFINDKLKEIDNSKHDLETYQQYNQAIQPLLPYWAAQGMNPAMGLAQLTHYAQMLNNDPQALINEIAQSRNIDLTALVEESPYIDPQIQQIQQQNQQLQAQYQQLIQQQQYETQQSVINKINDFANAKDDNGNPVYPYFADVQNDMTILLNMPNNNANDLESAYKMAVQYNPDIQKRIQDEAKKQESVKRQNEALKATSASTKTNSKTKDAPATKLTWQEQIEKDITESWGD